jgi:rSAM/selenodomain-associated transferase 2
MQLSIIIPVLNDAVALARLLAILQPMRSRGAQVIVVDGDSTDSPDHVTADLADDFLIAARGRATQQHAGALRASGDAFWFLHADCVPAHNADTLIEQALARGQWGRFDVKLSGQSPWLAVIAWTMNQRSRLTGICTGDQGIFVSRSAYEAVQGMPQIQLMEDVEFSKRLKQLSRPVRVVQPCRCPRGDGTPAACGARFSRCGGCGCVIFSVRIRPSYIAFTTALPLIHETRKKGSLCLKEAPGWWS